ncbi:FixH family protein [Glaciecola petra]|uniref:FixH family protein n=1 Tax=Glaciecola petra TaxID=3075602 RepID=A0ABU2ZNQ5_9ALTE|nr:FixH family protein [Aestuariibacter sp. P117]MDT0594252.1 FixH family protein [Aestuariibacter sp. P117]
MQEYDDKPWYKQFWPWFLIAIPLSSLIVGSQVIRLATDGTNSMVVDDYYKEGKSINERLDKIVNAQALNISTMLQVEEGNIALTFLSGQPATGEALKLDFFHVTQANKDFNVFLTRDASGVYRNNEVFPIKGKWRLRLTPIDENWKIQKNIHLPQNNAFKFDP